MKGKGTSFKIDHLLHDIVNRSSDFFGVAAPDGTILYVNDAGRKMLGVPEETDLTQTVMTDYIHHRDQAFFDREVVQATFQTGEAVTRLNLRHFKTQKPIPVEIRFFSVLDQAGEIQYYMAFCKSLHIEIEYQKLSKLNQSVQSLASVGGWELDIETGEIIWTDEVYEIYGIPKGTSITKIKGISYYAPHDRKRITQYVEDCISKKQSYDDIFEFIDHQGKKKWVRAIGEPILDPRGKVTRLVGTFQDVTDEKNEHNEILISKNRLKKLIDVVPAGIFETDLNGNYVFINEEWKTLTGLSEKEAQGDGWKDAVHPDDREEVFLKWKRATSENRDFDLTYRFQKTNGEITHVRGRSTAITSPDGRTIGYLGAVQDITKELKMQEELQRSNEEISRFFEVSLDLLCIANLDGYFIKINPMFSKILGYTEEELLTKPFINFVHPEDIDSTLNELEKLNQGELSVNFQNRYRCKDGSYRHFRWVSSTDPEKGLAYASAHDVTELMEIQNELTSYKTGLDNHSIVATTTPEGVITDVNDRFVKVSGYSRKELIGKTHHIINSGEHPKSFWRHFWKTISSGQTWRGEIKNKAKSGNYYWVDTTIAPIFGPNGKIKKHLAFRFEITERKELEERLISKTAHLNHVIQNSPGMVYQFVMTHQGEFYFPFVSNQAFLIYGLSPEEFKKDSNILMKMVHPDEIETLTQAILKSAQDLSVFEWKGRIVDVNQQVKWIQARSTPVRKENGDTLWDGVIIDITKEVEQENEMMLQKQIYHHNAKLASIGELAAGVGHEINNPLAIIKGNLFIAEALLSNSPVKIERVRKVLRKANLAGERIEKIVLGLRTFSRSDDLSQSSFNLYDAIYESVMMIQEIYKQEGIDLKFHSQVKEENAVIFGNRGRIQQIIMNLLSNSKDSTEDLDQRRIDVFLDEAKDLLTLTVKDNGRGIKEEFKDKIFDPFFTTKEVHKGTGIGLSLVHQIVKEHDGDIKVESKPNQGSSFTITLKKSKQERPVEAPESTPKLNPSESIGTPELTHSSQKMRALIVDDEPDIRDLLEMYLIEIGIESSKAENGKVAFEMLQKNPDQFNLVISDVKMPEMDGIELFKKIKTTESLSGQLKFVFVTGGSKELIAKQDQETLSKIDGIFYKPFDHTQIKETVDQIFFHSKKKAA